MIIKGQLSRHNGKVSYGRYTQDWSIGNTVKVGFLKLKVIDFNGTEYILESSKGLKYSFEPHIGLNKIS